jgi:hypothetical protein
MSDATYPTPESWEYATARQARRAARSFGILRRKAVPVYPRAFISPDEDEVALQDKEDLIRRVWVLWAVALRGTGCRKMKRWA